MRYQGGRVIKDPRIYVVFWGSEWGGSDANGMPTADPLGVATAAVGFFGRLGGSGDTWSPILTQYCSRTMVNDRACGPGSSKISKLTKSPFRGAWVDVSPGPGQSNLDTQLGARNDVTERALTHFDSNHPDDIVVLMLPPGQEVATSCNAFHSVAHTRSRGSHPIIVMDYPVPGHPTCPGSPPVCDLGKAAECLPKTEYTITGWASHEFAEVLTNPFPSDCLRTTGLCGWIVKDAPAWASRPEPLPTEISDTCASYRFVQLGGQKTVVATLWSNSAQKGQGACVARYVSVDRQE